MNKLIFDGVTPILDVYAGFESSEQFARSALILSHDLSSSGAPKIVFEMAHVLMAVGHNVAVVSPVDGPFRPLLEKTGVTVVVDGQALEGSLLLIDMAAAADVAICNTIVTYRAVNRISDIVPTYWYLHEVSLVRAQLEIDLRVRETFKLPRKIWAGSELSAAIVRPYRPDVEVFGYGLEKIRGDRKLNSACDSRFDISVFGSFEPRKGQDLALEAIANLPAVYRSRLRMKCFGRVLAREFYQELLEKAASLPEVEIHGELPYNVYLAEMLATDVVLVSSRDDTLPLVSIDALGSGRILLCTRTTGTSSFITHGVSGFVADAADATSIGAIIREAIDQRSTWPEIGAAAREVFLANFSREAFASALISRLGLSRS